MTEFKNVIEIVQQLGPWVSGIVATYWFLTKQVWPWLSVYLDKKEAFREEMERDKSATQKALASAYQQLATAFTQLSDWMRRIDVGVTDIHARVVAADNKETTD